MKILIASPIHRPVELSTFVSFVRAAGYRESAHTYDFMFVQNSLVYAARDSIATAFLQSSADALMMIDSDMTFPSNAIDILAEPGLPFITAKAFKRVPPFQPCFYTRCDYDTSGAPLLQVPIQYQLNTLLEIEGCGMACVLIHRSAFDNLSAPYFEPLSGMGEDLSFCMRLKSAGVKMYVHTGLEFGHLGVQEYGEKHFVDYVQKKHAEGADLSKIFI
jgi:hypothetical protein